MSVKIVITESQYSKLLGKLNEQEEVNPLFKSSYNSEDKTTTASYYVMDETPNSYVVVNPQEYKSFNEWVDGAQDYSIKFDIVDLPKNKVQIVGSIDGFPQFKIFKIPYWLFKKEPKLVIKRFDGNKRMSYPKDENILKDIRKKNIEGAFIALGGDTKKLIRGMELFSARPKKNPQNSQSPQTTQDSKDDPFYTKATGKKWTGD